ncbi:hypothetical protein BG000_006546 [Podila horticola]|nr:hypothetical protein BG000_006546 [Podila horticola]
MNREHKSAEFVSGDKTGKPCNNHQAAQANRQAQQQNRDGGEHCTAEFVSADQANKQNRQPQEGGFRRAQ